ncbi:hypothetical protein [Aureibacillus halotolerans]|uniref:Histidine kinase N-terminal 7TM region domain-containing protein n=1 Tax=Aureibacillus halotolerans TaxID=1508390 RepID=A0A4R6TRF4_9BACI|nr:hypothetical protein [Aureibacillus halotolerans]TDQ34605.1 hypothetical protein EV213_12423 [Aureibacillus halotolerans]
MSASSQYEIIATQFIFVIAVGISTLFILAFPILKKYSRKFAWGSVGVGVFLWGNILLIFIDNPTLFVELYLRIFPFLPALYN